MYNCTCIVIGVCCRAFTTIGKQQNKQIMQNNVETQDKHMYLLNIGSLCNVAHLWHALPAS